MLWNPSVDYRMAFKEGMQGTDVAALQLNLKGIAVDGNFGPATKARVLEYQGAHSLVQDGVAGGVTQTLLCKKHSAGAAKAYGVPRGFLPSLMVNESGFYLAAVSPHLSDGGLDVGAYQRSTGSQPGSQTFYANAYDVELSAGAAAVDAKGLHDHVPTAVYPSRYYDELADGEQDKFAWQMAALNHNWKTAAYNIPRKGYAVGAAADDDPAQWIVDVTRGRLHTPREWCMAYVEKATVFVTW